MEDMHIHSIHSDGTHKIEDIINKSKEKGINTISITDHDTVEGYIKEKEIIEKSDINIVKG